MDVSCEFTSAFQALLQSNEKMSQFKDIFFNFMQDKFPDIYPAIPSKIEFSLFQDPDMDFSEPRIEVHVQAVEGISRARLQEQFTRGLKEYLAFRSKDSAEFKELRKIQRQFMIIFKIA
nr:hypothetical protein [Candidatus Sigynarchaeota archaeon]